MNEMINYLNHKEIDKQKWDDCIYSSSNGRIYALSWYLDTVCKNWEALVEGDYKAVMPLTTGKKYGINYLFQPHFTQQLGIFSAEKITLSNVEKFLNAIPEKFRFAEFCINSENSEEIILYLPGEKKGQFSNYSLKKNSNYELALKKDYNILLKKYSENTKRNIKKAIKSGITVSSGQANVPELIKLFRKNKGLEFSHLKNDYYQLLKSLLEVCRKKNLVKVLGAFSAEKKLVAGAVFIIHKGRAIFLFSATDQEAKEKGAMFLLVDKFISEHAETLDILDFEGSNDAGLARFYKSFGAKEYVYLQLKKNNLPKYIQWLKK